MGGANHLVDQIRAAIPSPAKTFAETPAGTRFSYGDLFGLSARYAHVLVDLGLRPGDRVAMQVQKSIPALVLYLATLRAGGVFLPLNPAYTAQEMGYFLGDAAPHVLVCDPGAATDLAEAAAAAGIGHVETLDQEGRGTMADRAAAAETEFIDLPRSGDDLAALLYTSGTTGRSKGAMLSHENLASNARALVEAWRFGADDVLLHALPIFHTHGLFVATNVALFCGASLLYLPRFDVDAVIGGLARATVMMGVPTFYVRLLASAALTRKSTAHMRLFISGSAPLPAAVHREFEARTGHAILERYGMTETSMNTSNPYDGERRPGTVGPPLPGVDIRITELGSGATLARGAVGMIEIKGPNVFAGYWRMAEKTAQEFRGDGYFITGDMGRIDPDGYVSIVGREKDLIITGGLNVYPAEVEREIDKIGGVGECAVIGVPHADLGEAVVAVLVLSPGAELAADDIGGALAGSLAGFKRPKAVFFVDALPRNAMGKIEKARLREIHRRAFGGGTGKRATFKGPPTP
ncbi:MAG: malonyl-CoA synthase [Alphaproteobacteria bacterium]|nr:MAG: malonyl-CoA synthase [Alphaproteobacteria bacterium]